jgi:molybdate transport system ATP-binding protein
VIDRPGAKPLHVTKGEIKFENVSFAYDPERPILKHVSFEVPAGKMVAIVGPSGAGKSTILRLIAGLVPPTQGEIECDGERWFGAGVDVPVERRRVGFVFQDYALFPHRSVIGNVAFEARRDPDELLRQLGIGHLARARPRDLSGGERQRVALARALATDPRLLLLDEPLAALDPSTRASVAAELAGILETARIPAITVTHSYEEATTLAEHIVVVDRGHVVQAGTGEELLHSPASRFVADFAGVNFVSGYAEGAVVHLPDGSLIHVGDAAEGPVAVLVAPWEITLELEPPADTSAMNHVRGVVERVTVQGNRARVTVGGLTAEVTPASVERLGIRAGQSVVASWKATSTRVVPRPDGSASV